MSRVNGEKARANVARRNRTKRRVSDRARLAEIKQGNAAQATAKPAKEAAKPAKETAKPAKTEAAEEK